MRAGIRKPHHETKSGIDWPALHRRMDAVRRSVKVGRAVSDQEKRNILRMRAAQIAVPKSQPAPEAILTVTKFSLGKEVYAVESSYIRQVSPVKHVTPLPGTPDFVLGLVNVRGLIVSVVDLRPLFDLPVQAITNLSKILLLYNSEMEFGIFADNIIGFESIAASALQSRLPTLTGLQQDYFEGVTSSQMVVLDAAKILEDQRLVLNQTENG